MHLPARGPYRVEHQPYYYAIEQQIPDVYVRKPRGDLRCTFEEDSTLCCGNDVTMVVIKRNSNNEEREMCHSNNEERENKIL